MVTLAGEIDMYTAPVLGRALAAAAATDPPRLIIDMAELTFIDAAGLRVLLPLATVRHAAGRPFVLRAPPPVTWRVMRALGLDAPFVVEPAPRPEPTAG